MCMDQIHDSAEYRILENSVWNELQEISSHA